MKRDLSKSFKNDTYSDEELLKLSQKCADMSHSDIVSNLNSTITQQLSHDMNHGYYVPKEIGTEKVYVCCTMSHPKGVKFTTVPQGMLRGEKIPLENFIKNFKAHATPGRNKGRELYKFGKKHTRY